ncbi:hypothetical protein FH972_025077 [Carpinus fangiana]|uniref:Fatty acid hydroxylase domain-containing protein n=1 Tax=Carpinus fangiana TaxID=176857 RepID=A0A5N6KZZ7_9ROSI|nr:hypothetical protein FH972_025077 [Carpinus fangiana]
MAASGALPPLPAYTLQPLEPLIPSLPDKYLTVILPILAYWSLSMVFHVIDVYDLFPQYRLHTPAEVLKRNHVTRWEVVRDVVIQQVIQTIVGLAIAWNEDEAMTGKDDHNVAIWALRLRLAQQYVPSTLALFGLDSIRLASDVMDRAPVLAGLLAGGQYPWLAQVVNDNVVPRFAVWEMIVAKSIYWVGIPALQFGFAIFIVDTWQYFLHRAMHMNKWLYTTFHSRHHRLYVPYAYGALYNHPFEGFLLDTLGTGMAYMVSGMTPRQSMWFFSCSTFKTVDDHCGYALPWDPLQHITSNNAGYHDVHHQSWGIKTNFSQPFFTFWDRLLGTVWTGGDVSARYERARLAAQKKVDNDAAASITGSMPSDSANALSNSPYDVPEVVISGAMPTAPAGKAARQAASSREQVLSSGSAGGIPALAEETAEEQAERIRLRRSPRKASAKTNEASPAPLKGLRDRVNSGASSFHGRTGSMLGYDGR